MDTPTRAVEKALAEVGMNRADLARKLKVTPQALSRVLKVEQVASQRSLWPEILNALGLEIVIQPKEGSK
ncbi:hypothetical protein GCM10022631_11920 [Deinococcus rubellus]|uniref:Helix-turn-helix domain-containing protein n=1 Tax=Deinococcus rubellus TaxID=1889240 RepID=A0ABY5YCH8_9DEIO|nr:helix-turn-helix domain-containing protein [Deinococcus rubellus]UWX62762.1 helix-turn-helix domain-containing protein [Deinococcus rubellus]